jgi:hypothetical protein
LTYEGFTPELDSFDYADSSGTCVDGSCRLPADGLCCNDDGRGSRACLFSCEGSCRFGDNIDDFGAGGACTTDSVVGCTGSVLVYENRFSRALQSIDCANFGGTCDDGSNFCRGDVGGTCFNVTLLAEEELPLLHLGCADGLRCDFDFGICQ